MPPFVYTMRVRFRSAYMRAIGVPWQEMVKSGTDMYYVNASCDYLGSARFEEDIHVETHISKVGNSSFTSTFVIRNSERQPLAKASVTSVCVDPETREKVKVPDRFREAIAGFEEDRGGG